MPHIDVRMSSDLKAAIEAAAKADGRAASEWARRALAREVQAVVELDAPIPFRVVEPVPEPPRTEPEPYAPQTIQAAYVRPPMRPVPKGASGSEPTVRRKPAWGKKP